jgi:nucleotide-binding universal stress UspA family protein
MYRTILIPLENSPVDQAILDHIRELARLMNSKLVLIHVADGFAARHQKGLNLAESEEMREDRTYLEQRRNELRDQGLDVDIILACGDPTTEIVAAAEQTGCDLIAMATHGHRFVKDVLLGSVAEGVRHRTQVPVLLVRAKHSP